ncbi:MAG: Asp23/Gls24 family envelope stress response protein [Thermovirgaceae bacterium]|nr:Asp23/Gls24 family envelope stress response protein [Thermovirgaceae bacterium]
MSSEAIIKDVAGGSAAGTKDGNVRISEKVIEQIATQALGRVIGVRPADAEDGKNPSGGVRITVKDGVVPAIAIDAHITTKYGLRIPDISWYVQESIKRTLEQNTGYSVIAVNVFVQGVYLE